MKTWLTSIIFVIVLIAGSWIFRNNLQAEWNKRVYYSFCDQPIKYRIDQVDPQFNLSVDKFVNFSDQAAEIWNQAEGKKLLEFDPKAKLSVNLVYDERQTLNNQITSLQDQLAQQKNSIDPAITAYEQKVADFKKRLSDLNAQIESWNQKGGAPKDVYQQLIQEQEALKAEADSLNALARQLNQSTQEYNVGVKTLNQTINNFNQELQYKPEEGLYDGRQNKITIYFYINKAEIIHTLAHEFGHALGLPHIENPQAIMFPRTTQQLKPSADDLASLTELCRQRSIFDGLQEKLQQRWELLKKYL